MIMMTVTLIVVDVAVVGNPSWRVTKYLIGGKGRQ
jgi:hypothetical protein